MADIHDGSQFMTPEENAAWLNLLREQKSDTSLPYLRERWEKHADKAFIASFTTIHWADPEKLQNLIWEQDRDTEVCCEGFLQPPYLCGWMGGFGAIIEGIVTLSGNRDLQTNQWSGLTRRTGKKFTEYASELFTNRSNYRYSAHPEFVLSKWKITGIVIDKKAIENWQTSSHLNGIIQLAKKHRLQIIDSEGHPLQM